MRLFSCFFLSPCPFLPNPDSFLGGKVELVGGHCHYCLYMRSAPPLSLCSQGWLKRVWLCTRLLEILTSSMFLTLDKAQTSLALYSLTRNIQIFKYSTRTRRFSVSQMSRMKLASILPWRGKARRKFKVFRKPNEQNEACFNSAMARKSSTLPALPDGIREVIGTI